MTTYDWIVVGAGITGSAMAYELAQAGFSVLLLDQEATPSSATRYSYGGAAFWSGDTPLLKQLCEESETIYPTLADELGHDIQFRMLDLLLTVAVDRDPSAIAQSYQACRKPPTQLSPQQAHEIEPLLAPSAIAGALHARHGNVEPGTLARAYQQALKQQGGEWAIATVTEVLQTGDRVHGVRTPQGDHQADNVLLCIGGLSRAWLQQAGFPQQVYFTHAELIETPPLDLRLQSLVMPAELARMPMEADATQAQYEALWNEPGHEPVPPILDVGAIQYRDGVVRMGQISRVLTDPHASVDAAASEAYIRQGIGQVLPALKPVSGTWAHCLVGFSGDRLPLIGAIPQVEGLHVCAGFNGPFLLAPPIAKHFAQYHQGNDDTVMPQLSPARFAQSAR